MPKFRGSVMRFQYILSSGEFYRIRIPKFRANRSGNRLEHSRMLIGWCLISSLLLPTNPHTWCKMHFIFSVGNSLIKPEGNLMSWDEQFVQKSQKLWLEPMTSWSWIHCLGYWKNEHGKINSGSHRFLFISTNSSEVNDFSLSGKRWKESC